MTDTNKNMEYTVGRGRVYFNRFKTGQNYGTGERYLGNTPSFAPTNDTETLDHYSSEAGIRQKDASVILQVDQNGAFTCDDITAENLALFFLGETTRVTSLGGTDLRDDDLGEMTRGRHYQLGTSDLLPSGVRNTQNVVVGYRDYGSTITTGDITADPAVTILSDDNYTVDLLLGRVYIEAAAPDYVAGKVLVAQYDELAQSRTITVGKNNMAYGSLRYIADNPVGANNDYFYPKVSIAPDGEYALKGDEWQVVGFTFQALKLGGREMVYIDHRGESQASVADPTLQRVVEVTTSANTGTVGGAAVVVTATVRDGNATLVVGETVNFTIGGADASVAPTSGVTNASGVVTTDLTATGATSVTVTATVVEAGITYTGTSNGVTFTV